MGGFIPEISTLHPVAIADALKVVVRLRGANGRPAEHPY